MKGEILIQSPTQTKKYVVRDINAKRFKDWCMYPILYQSNDLNRCQDYMIIKGLI